MLEVLDSRSSLEPQHSCAFFVGWISRRLVKFRHSHFVFPCFVRFDIPFFARWNRTAMGFLEPLCLSPCIRSGDILMLSSFRAGAAGIQGLLEPQFLVVVYRSCVRL